MYEPVPFPDSDDFRSFRGDPIVAQAIAIVAAHQPMEEWWSLAPGVRTHAIYDEIRRLDRTRVEAVHESAADTATPEYQKAA
jgi:hypothetical protein